MLCDTFLTMTSQLAYDAVSDMAGVLALSLHALVDRLANHSRRHPHIHLTIPRESLHLEYVCIAR